MKKKIGGENQKKENLEMKVFPLRKIKVFFKTKVKKRGTLELELSNIEITTKRKIGRLCMHNNIKARKNIKINRNPKDYYFRLVNHCMTCIQ